MISIIPPIRGIDDWGSGEYGASRGNRIHNGIDILCPAGSAVLSRTDGIVTKIGYPYRLDQKGRSHYRYVEVTTGTDRFRYFYVKPTVTTGCKVLNGSMLGTSQSLLPIYPGIQDHVHFEIKLEDDSFVNPKDYSY